jgi:hypothetical protein
VLDFSILVAIPAGQVPVSWFSRLPHQGARPSARQNSPGRVSLPLSISLVRASGVPSGVHFSFRFFGCWQGSPVATDFLRQCSFSCCPGFILLAVLVSCSRASVPRPESLLRISIAGDGSSTGSSSGFPIQLLQLVSNSRSGPILGSEARWKIFFS